MGAMPRIRITGERVPVFGRIRHGVYGQATVKSTRRWRINTNNSKIVRAKSYWDRGTPKSEQDHNTRGWRRRRTTDQERRIVTAHTYTHTHIHTRAHKQKKKKKKKKKNFKHSHGGHLDAVARFSLRSDELEIFHMYNCRLLHRRF